MRLNQLKEAPVSDLTVSDLPGDPEKIATSFNDRDWAQVSKTSLQTRLIKSWGRSKHDFNLNFVRVMGADEEELDWTLLSGRPKKIPTNKNEFFNVVGKIVQNDNLESHIRHKGDSINVLFLHHLENAHPMSPWIIAHRISHGFVQSDFQNYYEPMEKIFLSTFKVIRNGNTQEYYDFLGRLLPMRSARENFLSSQSEQEIYNELFAMYIIKGRIIFNDITIDDMPERFKHIYGEEYSWRHYKNRINKTNQDLNDFLDSYLTALEGKWVLAD